MTTQKNVGWVRPEAVTHQDEKQGWRSATLGEFVATKTRGIVPNKTPGTTFELYSVPSLDTGSPEIVRGSEIGSNKQIVDEGTVLLCKINPRINRSWVVSSHTANQKIASTEWITFPPSDAFEPKYLAYYLKQDAVRDFLAANASGVGGSLMRVKPATLKDYPFPLAPLDQQKHIVAEIEKQFSRLDEAVANLQRVKANLKRYKAAVLKAAVEGRLVETEAEIARREGRSYETGAQLLQRILETRRSQWKGKGKYKEPATPDTIDLPELPEGWEWATIGQAAECLDSMRVPVNKKERLKRAGDVPYYGANGRVGSIDDYIFNEPLVLVVEDETFTGREIPFTYKIAGKSWVNNHAHVLRPTGMVTLDYLNYALSYYPFTPLTTGTTGRKKLTQLALVNAPLGIPPLLEQHRIVEEVDRRLSLVSEVGVQVDANLTRTEHLRQSVLACAFSARLSAA